VVVSASTRLLVLPSVRIFLGRLTVPLPSSIHEAVSWATDPASALARPAFAFAPVDVLFRTQYFLALDARADVALPASKLALLGRRLRRRLMGDVDGGGDVAEEGLRAALAARVMAEGPACVASYSLQRLEVTTRQREREQPPRRRRLRRAALEYAPAPALAPEAEEGANNASASPLAALLRVDPIAAAATLLGGGDGGAKLSSASWARLLALRLTEQASLYAAQVAEARAGLNFDLSSRPVAVAAAFARCAPLFFAMRCA
jgi:hypothetical protein